MKKGMNMSNRQNKAVLMVGTIMASLAVVSPAYAQSDSQPQENPVGTDIDADAGTGGEAIVVTGSRIQRRDLTSTSPLATVQDEEFKLSGSVNVEQVINTLPQVVPGATSFSNNPGGGVATLNLRGIGTARTLVLVNGRRYVSFDPQQIVDLNTIPQFLLDSVDVVTGGASAVYGSDALAGVVNFRLKQDLSGIEAGGQYSITDRGDGARYQGFVAIGANTGDGRGNVTAYAEYFRRKSVFQGAREFSRFALGDDGTVLSPAGSPTTPQGRISVAPTSVVGVDPDGAGPLTAPTLTRGVGAYASDFGANFGSPGVSDVFDFPGDLYNYAPANYLQVPQERYSIGGYGHYDITDNMTAFVEATFVNNRVANELAATPVGGTFNVNLANSQAYLSAADFAQLQQIDANETAINAARAAAGLAPLFGPAATGGLDARLPGIVQLSISRRILETGSRNTLDERNAFRVLAGVRGGAFADWTYEAYYSYARTRNANIQAGNISSSAYRRAVENGTINVFGAGTLDQADVDSISILAQNGEISTLQVASASLAGTLGNFGWGAEDIGLAIGTEYRKVAAQFIPDTALSSGDVVGFNAGDPTAGSYNVKEVFGEIRVPLIADKPFFYRLDLNGAARYSDYSLEAVGGTWTYAGGIEFAPVPDITFRAQYQRAVRAPNVGELFGGQSNGFPGATDPCSLASAATNATINALCQATGVPAGLVGNAGLQPASQIQGLFGGNPDLEEETSDTYTAGVVIRPSFIPRLNISVDYFNITVDNYISTLGGGLNGTLDLCYNVIQDINSVYCQAIANGGRNPANGQIGDGDFLPLIGNANVAKVETQGVDLQVDYSMPLSFGMFGEESKVNFFFLGTYTKDFKFYAVQDLDDFTQCAGRFGQLVCGNPQPKYKWSSRLSWIDGPLTTSLRWRHLGSVRDDDVSTDYVVERLKSYNLIDLSLGFDITEQFSLSMGVNNLFDKQPQLIGDNQEQGNTYPGVYDVLGRDYFVSVNLKF
ncbi:TonB-dependent receptor domain-containing protein [Parafrankia sp. BMG5.11]|uniref:TonB-dependent receptor domain-containing protein n=1 Tax=Parafrankia sp. BMG5.11 TaxID=222540 RepID=UPI001A9F76AD|nr:TonB-dependent receptor [Parafrankia sp. BMG5.11]